jgi:hypothetical protein
MVSLKLGKPTRAGAKERGMAIPAVQALADFFTTNLGNHGAIRRTQAGRLCPSPLHSRGFASFAGWKIGALASPPACAISQ